MISEITKTWLLGRCLVQTFLSCWWSQRRDGEMPQIVLCLSEMFPVLLEPR